MVQVDDDLEARPDGWSDAELANWLEPGLADVTLLRQVRLGLDLTGWVIVEVSSQDAAQGPEAARRATALLSGLGRPMRIFAGRPLWRALISDPSRPAHSSGGMGAQEGHIDFVNAELPPDLVVLYCVRADAGGASVVAPVRAALTLSNEDLALLSRPVFHDGVMVDLDEVGGDVNPFAVWNPHARHPLRWTGKLLYSKPPGQEREALKRLRRALAEQTVEIRMLPGQMLVVDQRRAVHGRRALMPEAQNLSENERRLLMHGFVRVEEEA